MILYKDSFNPIDTFILDDFNDEYQNIRNK